MHADGTVQQDPAALGVRAGPDPGRGAAPGPRARGLLNIKVKVEAEITTCHQLLKEGEDLHLDDTLDNSNSIHSIQKTNTHRIWMAKWSRHQSSEALRQQKWDTSWGVQEANKKFRHH